VFVTAPSASALHWALENAAPGGTVHAFAGVPGGAAVDANLVHYRHLRLVGSTGSRLEDYRCARDLVADGTVAPTRLPHRVVPLEDAPRALLDTPPTEVLKTVIAVGPAAGATAPARTRAAPTPPGPG
jgi:L-iditol 2-dehydrogenase